MPPFKNTTGLRNRYRVTNKSRLRIIKQNVDAENVVFDEDEERARVVSTAGVDAEDANEHHLRAVLEHKTQDPPEKSTSCTQENTARERTHAYIPVPDAEGLVDNYAELYPSTTWLELNSYVKYSYHTDESLDNGLADGLSYFMDERDKEWLEKNNQIARGEGTSSHATLSASGTTTRSGASRGAKHKGKEPDPNSPISMTEDEFELVMGIFEKLTHDRTPYWHVGLQQGMAMPPFSEYQDVFASDLPKSIFATFIIPSHPPVPSTLVHMARTVYPYWRDRRIERDGHRIIPTLNFDESDTKNESYVCFRRRDVKAIRKTRTAQVSPEEKLTRLKRELATAAVLANSVVEREIAERDAVDQSRHVWEKRLILVDMRKEFSVTGGKEDDELLFDKERVPKRPKNIETPAMQHLKLKKAQDSLSSPVATEPYLRPRDRTILIQNMIEEHLKRQKERDHHWDDLLDNPYQSDPLPWTEQLFKGIPEPGISSASTDASSRTGRPMRLRVGRGGRLHIDRRTEIPQGRHALEQYLRHKPSFPHRDDGFSKAELDERAWRIADRWKFDSEVPPSVSDGGITDEEERILMDDFQPKYIRSALQLVQEQDHLYFHTDTRPTFAEGNGGLNLVSPFRMPQPGQARRDGHSAQRSSVAVAGLPPMPPAQTQINGPVQLSPPTSSAGQAIPPQTPIRKMAPPAAPQQLRVPSTDGFRASSSSSLAGAVTMPPSQAPNLVNGNTAGVHSGANGAVPQVTLNDQISDTAMPYNTEVQQPPSNVTADVSEIGIGLPSQSKSHDQQRANGHHIQIANAFPHGITNGSYNGFSNGIPNGYANHVPGLSIQQTRDLKVAFAGIPPNQGIPLQSSLPVTQRSAAVAGYPTPMQNGMTGNGLPGNISSLNMLPPVAMTLKLPATRQQQLAAANGGGQRPLSAPNVDLLLSPNNLAQTLPNRTSSANGLFTSPMRLGQSPSHQFMGQDRVVTMNGHHFISQSLSPHFGSPAQMHATPVMNMQSPVPSPSPQHQIVGMNGIQGATF